MMKNLIFGQYIYKNSIIHNIDARVKILLVLLTGITLLATNNLTKLMILTFFALFLLALSQMPFYNMIIHIKPFVVVYVFVFLMYIFFSRDMMLSGLITFWRFLILIMIVSILTFSTTIGNIVLGFEKLMKPLALIKINHRTFALLISLTIRFIPCLFIEGIRIRDAIYSRLGNFKKFKHIKLFLQSMFEKVIIKASNLSDAIESRCYSGQGTHFKEMKLGKSDFIALFGVLIFLMIILVY